MTASPTKLALLKKAENELIDAAITLVTGSITDHVPRQKFLDLADEYARARWSTKTGASGQKPRPSTSSHALTISRSKGQPISKAATEDLKWAVRFLEESINNPAKERWRESNQSQLDAINAELRWRGES